MTAVELIGPVAAAPTAMAMLVVAIGFIRTLLPGRDATTSADTLGLGLELLLAAGLIRLATVDSRAALGAVAVLLIVRSVAVVGLRHALRRIDGT
jgi:hypothetical protein